MDRHGQIACNLCVHAMPYDTLKDCKLEKLLCTAKLDDPEGQAVSIAAAGGFDGDGMSINKQSCKATSLREGSSARTSGHEVTLVRQACERGQTDSEGSWARTSKFSSCEF